MEKDYSHIIRPNPGGAIGKLPEELMGGSGSVGHFVSAPGATRHELADRERLISGSVRFAQPWRVRWKRRAKWRASATPERQNGRDNAPALIEHPIGSSAAVFGFRLLNGLPVTPRTWTSAVRFGGEARD
jgi:hypothetical protein